MAEDKNTEEKFIKADDEKDCVAKGGEWITGRCVVKATKEDTTVSIDEVKAALDKMGEDVKELRDLYEEIINNLPEKEEGGESTEENTVPDFETFLIDLYQMIKDDEVRRKKYPYYPYPYYPRRGAKEEETIEDKPTDDNPEGSTADVVEDDPISKERERVVESLRNKRTIKEQWEPVCVDITTLELTGHLRDICMLSQVIKGKQGDVVNIPYVKDFEFEVLSSVGADFTSTWTGLVGSVTTTLSEAGFYTQIAYSDIEKLDADMLAKLEEKTRTAALRAEDRVILDALIAEATVTELDKSTATSFDADFVNEAIGAMQGAGKVVEPGDCVLVIDAAMYEDLIADVMGSMGLVFARPDVIQKGRLAEFLGVEIRVAGYLPTHTGTNESAYLIKKKDCVAFAPKRDLLIETWKDTKARKLQITATHTFGIDVVDVKSAVEIKTGM